MIEKDFNKMGSFASPKSIEIAIELLEKKINYLKLKDAAMDGYRNYNLIPLAFIDAKMEVPKFTVVRHGDVYIPRTSILLLPKHLEISLFFPQIDWKFTQSVCNEDLQSSTILSKINETKVKMIEDLFLNTYYMCSPLYEYSIKKAGALKRELESLSGFDKSFTKTLLQGKIREVEALINIYFRINRGFHMLNHYDGCGPEINKSFSLVMRSGTELIHESSENTIELDEQIKKECKMSLREWFR
jgi:hypothetical protein